MLSNKQKYKEFITICRVINTQLEVVPVLFGSLGLEVLSGNDFKSDDIDVLVPKIFIQDEWDHLRNLIESNGFRFVDLHEHEFRKNNIKIAFAFEESLCYFANVDYRNLKIINDEGANFKLLNYDEYLRVYQKSFKDSYRTNKNNGKDQNKIEFLLDKLNK